jgi:hypothetical protein
MHQHLIAGEVDVFPFKSSNLGRDAQPAVTTQNDKRNPVLVAARFDHGIDPKSVHKYHPGGIPLAATFNANKRVFRNQMFLQGNRKELPGEFYAAADRRLR